MARNIKDRAKQERLQAEWANVGLCGGMYRPAHNGSRPAVPPAGSAALSQCNADDWQPHNRCCP